MVKLKTRGTASNPDNRYAPETSRRVDDGWWQEAASPAVVTEVREDHARSIIASNRSPDIPFEQSINPYRGCEHGCIYCFARPSHAWLDLSPGLDFETRLTAKTNAARQLRRTLSRPAYRCSPVAMGTNTDPYQPVEKQYAITREILEVMLEYGHPVSIVTKSALVLRDLDLLTQLAERNLCRVMVSVTTLDRDLKRRLEPRTADPSARLRTIRTLNEAGVPCGVMAAPLIPALNDQELEAILEAAAAAGAREAGYIFLRLPLEVAPLFEEWLEEHVPGRKEHVLSLVRQSRGGQLYRSAFGTRQRGTGVFADLLEQRFEKSLRRYGLGRPNAESLDCSRFRPPVPVSPQLSLL